MTATKKALLVGINKYAQPGGDLRGCVNDALTWAKLLTENFGFNRENVRLLADDRATTDAIRRRLEWLVEDATPGSTLVFQYSGHGSQVRDRSGDELDDGLDEILCPHDLNWDDPFTDDELAAVIKRVPEGVNLTLILDCCHSGTGTREFFKEPSLGKGVVKRFLVPPPDIGFRAAAGVELGYEPERSVNMVGRRSLEVRRFGSALIDQNAILIAGCRSDQTSADAWIENDYRGALSYSLYRTITSKHYQLGYEELVRDAGDWLEQNAFSQIPQLECPQERRGWGFLGTAPHSPVSVSVPGLPDAASDGAALGAIAAPTTRVVFIHGIGNHEPGYSHEWRRAFNRYLDLPLSQFVEVVWDDVFDARERSLRGITAPPKLTTTEEKEAEALQREIRQALEIRRDVMDDVLASQDARSNGWPGVTDRTADRGFLDWFFNFDEYIGDFVKYLASSKVREAVDDRLASVLKPLVRSGYPIVLVSHSWGTVVAYDTLASMSSDALALHCTLGSPLWMSTVRHKLGFDGKRHGTRNWINVDARGDLIGGKLYGTYDVNHDYKVPSVGGQPHGSYFHPDNVRVQRDIVAKTVLRVARTFAEDPRYAPGPALPKRPATRSGSKAKS